MIFCAPVSKGFISYSVLFENLSGLSSSMPSLILSSLSGTAFLRASICSIICCACSVTSLSSLLNEYSAYSPSLYTLITKPLLHSIPKSPILMPDAATEYILASESTASIDAYPYLLSNIPSRCLSAGLDSRKNLLPSTFFFSDI